MSDYPRFRDGFAEAMDPRHYNIEWLDERLMLGSAFFWSSPNAAIVAKIKLYPTGAKDIHGLVATGEMSEIVGTLIPTAEAWGKAQGCNGAIIESRAGWQRILKSHGYAPFQMAVRKEY